MANEKAIGEAAREGLRVVLWDIDGTLVTTRRRGVFKDYTAPAVARLFGTSGRLGELRVSGMTDLQIVCEALRDEGVTTADVRARSRELCEHYLLELERLTNEHLLYYALPGAREALEATDRHPRYVNALLTGNLEPAARWKLRATGLDEFFPLPGAFGEDSHDRRDLPALAAARINERLKLDLTPAQFVVVGDTPNDISCARHFGARAVAVATGRFHPASELATFDPDVLLDDLTDTAAFLRALDSL
ncbi:MAG TPA: HAD hydrolase-like protein [Pyrinomonadaceae bacterium]|nr:HAD hydrolase-like protein [Pyrinomonadaceae bacterium]